MNKDDDAIGGEVDHSFFDSDYEEKQELDEAKQELDEGNISEISLKSTEHRDEKETDLSDISNSETNKLSEDDFTEVQEASEKKKEPLKRKSSKDDWDSPRSESGSSTSSSAKLDGSRSKGASVHSINSKARISTETLRDKRDGDEEYGDEIDSSEEEEQEKERLRPKSARYRNSFQSSGETKYISDSSSSSSVSDSSDTESDSYTSESSYSSSRTDDLDSSFSSPEHKSKLSLVPGAGKQKNRVYVEESEDTVTDVTPLSTPDMSPIQSFDLTIPNDVLKQKKIRKQENVSQETYSDFKVLDFAAEQEKSTSKEEKEKSPTPTSRSGTSFLSDSLSLDSEYDRRHSQKVLDDAMDLNHLLKAFMHLEKKEQKNVVIDYPTQKSRKNYSFSNEEVRRIDHENQRLLKELSREMSKPRSKSTTPKKPSSSSAKLYHTAINRQKEQQRIERENLALLKRLESVKPTTGMKRSEQLVDYQRQMGYLGSVQPPVRQNRSSGSKIPSSGFTGKGSRVSSASSHRTESASNASSAGLSRPNKPTKARAAWL